MLYESPFKPVGHDGPCHEMELASAPRRFLGTSTAPGLVQKLELMDPVDRLGWPAGEWDDEPDAAEWVTGAGYQGLALRNQLGSWCGYIEIPEGHALHGLHYDPAGERVHAHGGLTYSQPNPPPQEAIGDVPAVPGQSWWLGFDCGHSGDICPALLASVAGTAEYLPKRALDYFTSGTYRNLAYTKSEVERLADQLKDNA